MHAACLLTSAPLCGSLFQAEVTTIPLDTAKARLRARKRRAAGFEAAQMSGARPPRSCSLLSEARAAPCRPPGSAPAPGDASQAGGDAEIQVSQRVDARGTCMRASSDSPVFGAGRLWAINFGGAAKYTVSSIVLMFDLAGDAHSPATSLGDRSCTATRTMHSLTLSSPNCLYRGLLGTVTTVAREEGPAALWKGITPGVK